MLETAASRSPLIDIEGAIRVAEEFARVYQRGPRSAPRETRSAAVVFSSNGPVPIFEVTVDRVEKHGCLGGSQQMPFLHIQVHGDDGRILGVWDSRTRR